MDLIRWLSGIPNWIDTPLGTEQHWRAWSLYVERGGFRAGLLARPLLKICCLEIEIVWYGVFGRKQELFKHWSQVPVLGGGGGTIRAAGRRSLAVAGLGELLLRSA